MKKIAECQSGYIFWLFIGVLASSSCINGQNSDRFKEYKQLTKRVYHFTKVEFITEEGEFNEAICTPNIPDLKKTVLHTLQFIINERTLNGLLNHCIVKGSDLVSRMG